MRKPHALQSQRSRSFYGVCRWNPARLFKPVNLIQKNTDRGTIPKPVEEAQALVRYHVAPSAEVDETLGGEYAKRRPHRLFQPPLSAFPQGSVRFEETIARRNNAREGGSSPAVFFGNRWRHRGVRLKKRFEVFRGQPMRPIRHEKAARIALIHAKIRGAPHGVPMSSRAQFKGEGALPKHPPNGRRVKSGGEAHTVRRRGGRQVLSKKMQEKPAVFFSNPDRKRAHFHQNRIRGQKI